MEPPAKRARVGVTPWDDDDDDEANDDELTLSTIQFEARQDPMYQLDKKRAKSAFKLKSTFEDIFEKYGKDFGDAGDEINLHTGEVVVNNGHLQSLEDEDQDKSEDEGGEEDRVLKDKNSAKRKHNHRSVEASRTPHNTRGQPFSANSNNAWSSQVLGVPQPLHSGIDTIEPAWQIPELEGSMSKSGFGSTAPFSNGFKSLTDATGLGTGVRFFGALGQPYRRLVAAKDVGPKALISSSIDEEDQGSKSEGGGEKEDDALLGITGQDARSYPQPRLKKLSEVGTTPFEGLETSLVDQRQETTLKNPTTIGQSQRRRGRPRKHPKSQPTDIEVKDIPASTSTLDGGANSIIQLRQNLNESVAVVVNKRTRAVLDQKQTQTTVTNNNFESQGRRSNRLSKQPQRYSRLDWGTTETHQPVRVSTPPAEKQSDLTRKSLPPNNIITDDLPFRCVMDIELPGLSEPSDMDQVPRNTLPERAFSPGIETSVMATECFDSVDSTSKNILTLKYHPLPSVERTAAYSKAPSSPAQETSLNQSDGSPSPVNELLIGTDNSVYLFKDTVSVPSPTENMSSLDSQERDRNVSFTMDEVDLAPENDLREEEDMLNPNEIDDSTHAPDHSDSWAECVYADISIELGEPVTDVQSDGADVSVELGEPVVLDTGIGVEKTKTMAMPSESRTSSSGPGLQQEEDADQTSGPAPQRSVAADPERTLRPRRSRRSPAKDSSTFLSVERGQTLTRVISEHQPVITSSAEDRPRSLAKHKSLTSNHKSQAKSEPRTPKKIRTFSSLAADAPNEDELSILCSSAITQAPASNTSIRASFIRGISQAPSSRASTPSHSILASTPRHLSLGRRTSPALTRIPATDSGALRYGLKRKRPSGTGLAQSSPLARNVLPRTPQKKGSVGDDRAESPTYSSIRTPGGTVRRCGEDKYVCKRDFCFTCCE